MKRIALFAGSFDPYTNGHHDIVRKSAALFDEVVVMIAVNTQKRRAFEAPAMAAAIGGSAAVAATHMDMDSLDLDDLQLDEPALEPGLSLDQAEVNAQERGPRLS